MSGNAQSVALSQPSGLLDQQVTTAEVPITLDTPARKESKSQSRKLADQSKSDTDSQLVSTGFADSLADRIKAGTGRRKTTQSKTHVPSAAVESLAEAVDTIIAPGAGATERFLDSRDANRNVPSDIPGASEQQQQHAAAQPDHPRPGQHLGIEAASSALPEKPKKHRRSKHSKPALTENAPQLAQGPALIQDAFQEDEKVSKRHRARKQLLVAGATKDALAHSSAASPLLSNAASSSHDSSPLNADDEPSPAVEPKTPKQKRLTSVNSEVSPATASATAANTVSGDTVQQEHMQAVVPNKKQSASKAKLKAAVKMEITSLADVVADGEADNKAREQMPVVAPNKKQRTQVAAQPEVEAEASPMEAIAAAAEVVTSGDESGKKVKRQRVKATDMAVDTKIELVDAPKGRRSNRRKKTVQATEIDALVEGTDEGAAVTVTKKKRTAKAVSTVPVFEMPTREVLETAVQWKPTSLPVPNLGYACLNLDLREQKPSIFTNRDMIQKTFQQKGLPYVSELALQNVQALKGIIQWNHEHGIRFFRMTSNFLPWCTSYDMEDLPDFPAIADELAFAGKLARAYQQRLTFHPSHFVKVAAPSVTKKSKEGELLQRSLKELEVHSQVLDLMGYEPSHHNKINIHIGGVYGDKPSTLDRFAAGFERLSDNCKARLTLENDDWLIGFSVKDLLPLSQKCNIPIVFDFHHHKFCSGDWSEKDAFFAALETWPKGVRPAVHWSESQDDRKPTAHSDYIQGPMNLHGKEADVDVMIEAKCMERCLLRFRDETMMGKTPVKQAGSETKAVVNPASELASKFL